MAKTVIDSLIVELGLDPKKFKQGEKESVEALRDLEKNAKKTGEAVKESADKGGSAIMALGKRVLTVAAIFKVLSYTTKNVLEASRATYELSNNARLLGESAKGLRNFENVAEIFGGTAEGATKSIRGLKQALFELSFNGQMSQQLVQLSRLGVNVNGKGGKPRDFKDVYLDTADALQKNISSGRMTESEAMMFGESAGFDPGLVRSMVGGRDAASLALARQEARRQISDGDIAGATAAEQAMTSAGQAKGTAFERLGSEGGGYAGATRVAGALEGAWTAGATGEIEAAFDGWKAAIEPVTAGMGDLADATVSLAQSFVGAAHRMSGRSGGAASFRGTVDDAARRHGIPASLLHGVLATESNYDVDAVSGAGAVGIAQFMPATAAGRGFTAGVDPNRDIDEAAKYLAELRNSFLKTGSDPAAADDYALMSYNAGQRRVRTSSMYPGGTGQLTPETLAYPGRVYDAAAGWRGDGASGGTTTVDIGEVNVMTAATDSAGIASSIDGALKRKLTAAQAPSQGPQ